MISAEFCPCFPQTPLSILLDIQDPAACQTQLSIPSRSRDLAPAPCSASCTGTENLLSMPPLNGTLVPPVFAQHPVPVVGTRLSIPSRSGHPASLHIPFSTPPQSGDPASPDPAHLSLEPGTLLTILPRTRPFCIHSSRPRLCILPRSEHLGARTLLTILTGTRASCIPPDPSQHPAPQLEVNLRAAPLPRPGNSSLLHFLYFEPIPAESRK